MTVKVTFRYFTIEETHEFQSFDTLRYSLEKMLDNLYNVQYTNRQPLEVLIEDFELESGITIQADFQPTDLLN